ncbi:SRPBCC family protein [Paenibacillus pasadenensis]|uniref:CoxG family protein n=1 Tax=Paenibacillus pasadenensis TaxID=217090 RepID=UPI0020416DE4|nr:SRPBCC family protein [Paenibacillus pasadenensis]MCM3749391.1 SRPBCC family protein [Paenibacillus pasadenensis]
MPTGTYAVDVEAPLEQVWRFLKDPANWEPLMTGYIGHEIINERESTWTFKGDLGITTKLIKLQVNIKELAEPSKIAFQLSGLSDPVEGAGRFEAVSLGETSTRLTGFLEIRGQGFMAMMMNSVMKEFVPKNVESLTKAVADKLSVPKSQ